jgi:hypothetical protein
MKMVAHQTIGMDLPIGLLASLREGLQEILAIDVIQENVLLPITAAHDVINGIFVLDAQLSGHGATLGECQGRSKRKLNHAMV